MMKAQLNLFATGRADESVPAMENGGKSDPGLVEALLQIAADGWAKAEIRRLLMFLCLHGHLDEGRQQATHDRLLAIVELMLHKKPRAGKASPEGKLQAIEHRLASLFPLYPFLRISHVCTVEKGLTGIQSAKRGPYPMVVTAESRNSCDHFDFEGAAAIVPLVSSTGHGHASLHRLHYQEGKFALGNILCAIFPMSEECLSARFVFEYLTAFKEELLVSAMVGTANVSLTVKKIGEVPIPLVPIETQKKICGLMALLDDLEVQQAKARQAQTRFRASALEALTRAAGPEELAAAWARVAGSWEVLFERAESVGELRSSIFSFACRGLLTSRGAGSGAEVLRVSASRRARLAKEGSGEVERHIAKLAAQNLSPPATSLPSGWAWASLLAACVQLVDCHNKTAPYTSDGVMLVRTTNVRDGRIRLEGAKFVSQETYQQWSRRCPPEPGDILFTREAPMGEAGIIEPDVRLCMGQRMMLLRVDPSVLDPEYVLLAIRDAAFQERMIHAAVGSTVKHLRVGDVESLFIPIPPPEEQKRIVARVDALMMLCDDLEAKLKAREATAAKLVEAVVRELVAPAGDAPSSEVPTSREADAVPAEGPVSGEQGRAPRATKGAGRGKKKPG